MDIAALRAALRTPESPLETRATGSALAEALEDLTYASRRLAIAEAEAATARRASTLKATLKSAMAVERARQHVLAELRLLCSGTAEPEPPRLRICG